MYKIEITEMIEKSKEVKGKYCQVRDKNGDDDGWAVAGRHFD